MKPLPLDRQKGMAMHMFSALVFSLSLGADPQPKVAPKAVVTPTQAVTRALDFLEKDAAKWRQERKCATCHHGVMTLLAFSEARQQGHAVPDKTLAELATWSRDRFVKKFDPTTDLKPGHNMMPIASVLFSFAARNGLPGVKVEELAELETNLVKRQDADGAWLSGPPANAPVPFFESREVMTLWAYLALAPFVPGDSKKQSPARTSREKAAAWLAKNGPADTTQSAALRLIVDVCDGKPSVVVQPGIDRLLRRQNKDGGWSQVKELGSDAFATGQALYALSVAGVSHDRPEIGRGVAFLLSTQREDGSWPMTPRTTPERKASRNISPITHLGAAWATIGLVHSLPKEPRASKAPRP